MRGWGTHRVKTGEKRSHRTFARWLRRARTFRHNQQTRRLKVRNWVELPRRTRNRRLCYDERYCRQESKTGSAANRIRQPCEISYSVMTPVMTTCLPGCEGSGN